jgi:hypothetical protein
LSTKDYFRSLKIHTPQKCQKISTSILLGFTNATIVVTRKEFSIFYVEYHLTAYFHEISYVNEATYTQHITRRTMKISVKNDGQETEVFYNRCNFLAAMRKSGRSQNTMNKSNIKVEPLIGELAHLLHGGDLDE